MNTNLPRMSLNLGSRSIWYLSMYSYNSSVPRTLAIRTNYNILAQHYQKITGQKCKRHRHSMENCANMVALPKPFSHWLTFQLISNFIFSHDWLSSIILLFQVFSLLITFQVLSPVSCNLAIFSLLEAVSCPGPSPSLNLLPECLAILFQGCIRDGYLWRFGFGYCARAKEQIFFTLVLKKGETKTIKRYTWS